MIIVYYYLCKSSMQTERRLETGSNKSAVCFFTVILFSMWKPIFVLLNDIKHKSSRVSLHFLVVIPGFFHSFVLLVVPQVVD